ncbi:hypothetical protein BC830DRAFT_1102934 [Chytriomyces sp. MP71]|nr:hypothetical protein BC830DRAFT_1102934 [Chytriomyces sp. MP71]
MVDGSGAFCFSNLICVSLDARGKRVTLTTSARGWTALGCQPPANLAPGASFHSSPVPYAVYVATNASTVARRVWRAQGFQPAKTPVSNIAATTPSGQVAIANNRVTDAAYSVSFEINEIWDPASAQCFFALSNLQPSSKTSLPIHSARSAFAFSPIQPIASAASGSSRSSASGTSVDPAATPSIYSINIFIHAVLMFIAFTVFPVLAIFVVRYLQRKLSRSWLLIHGLLFGFGSTLCTILSLVSVESSLVSAVPSKRIFVPRSFHGGLGIFVCLVLLPVQLALGSYVGWHWESTATKTPYINKVHWWSGRFLLTLAVIQIQLGMSLAQAPASVMAFYWLWISAIASLFIIMGRKPSSAKQMPKLPGWQVSNKTIRRHLDKMQNTWMKRPLVPPRASSLDVGHDDGSVSSRGRLISNAAAVGYGDRNAEAGSGGYGTGGEAIALADMQGYAASPSPRERRTSELFAGYQQQTQVQRVVFSEPDEVSTLPRKLEEVQRVVFAEPDEVDTLSRYSTQPPLQRVFFEEPDEVDSLRRQTTRQQQPPQRILFEEPDELSLRRSTTQQKPPLQRVIFDEPDELDTLSRKSTQQAPGKRIFFEEPDELSLRQLTTQQQQSFERVIFEEPDELSLTPQQPPRERVFFEEPDELDALTRKDSQQPPYERIFFEEPDELDNLSHKSTHPDTPRERIIYSEPDEEEFDEAFTRQRIVYAEPDTLSHLGTTSAAAAAVARGGTVSTSNTSSSGGSSAGRLARITSPQLQRVAMMDADEVSLASSTGTLKSSMKSTVSGSPKGMRRVTFSGVPDMVHRVVVSMPSEEQATGDVDLDLEVVHREDFPPRAMNASPLGMEADEDPVQARIVFEEPDEY